jgi:prophage regulatory protein
MTNTPAIRFLSFDELKGFGINYCRPHIWRLEREGKFPRRVPIGEARIAWVESEIVAWQQQRIKVRDEKAA